jgi:release factor glutamine methyltransferase
MDNAQLDASLLMSHVLQVSRSSLFLIDTNELAPSQEAAYKALIEGRLGHVPVAYLIGTKDFYGLQFRVTPDVLIPRPDTEVLVEAALNILATNNTNSRGTAEPQRVLDLCTGSGAVAIALKAESIRQGINLDVYASDVSPAALAVAKDNAKTLLPKDNDITFLQGNLFDALSVGTFRKTPLSTGTHTNKSHLLPASFNLITANAPYIPASEIPHLQAEVQKEPSLALNGGPNGLILIQSIITQAPSHLSHPGCLLLEASPEQMQNINAMLKTHGFQDIKIYKDYSGQERVILGNKKITTEAETPN